MRMPDIAMCADKDCPSRETCHRFTAKPDEMLQTYGDFRRGDRERCDHYWPDEIAE